MLLKEVKVQLYLQNLTITISVVLFSICLRCHWLPFTLQWIIMSSRMCMSWSEIKLQNLGAWNQLPTIPMFNGNVVEPAGDFIYLGSMQSSDGYCRSDIRRRTGFASSLVSFLRRVWIDKHLSLSTKLRITKHLSYPSYYMHPRRGLYLPLTPRVWNPSTWYARGIFLGSDSMTV